MILLHEDDKDDLNKLKPQVACIFNLNVKKIKLIQENNFVIVQLED